MDFPHRVILKQIDYPADVRLVSQSGHRSGIVALGLSLDGKLVASVDEFHILKIWSVESVEVFRSCRLGRQVKEIRWLDDFVLEVVYEQGEGELIHIWGDSTQLYSKGEEIALLEMEKCRIDGEMVEVDLSSGRKPFQAKDQIVSCLVDPLERYLAVVDASGLDFISCVDGESLFISDVLRSKSWVSVWIMPHGESLYAVDSVGDLWIFDPVKRKERLVHRFRSEISVLSSYRDRYLCFGDKVGHVMLYDIKQEQLVFKTSRGIDGYRYEFSVPSLLGYAGFMDEYYGVYLVDKREIYPIRPLPSRLSCVCAGKESGLFYISTVDRQLHQLFVDSDDVILYGESPWPLLSLCSGVYGVVGYGGDGRFWYYNGEIESEWCLELEAIDGMSMSSDDNQVAILSGGELLVYERESSSVILRMESGDICHMVFHGAGMQSRLFVLGLDGRIRKVNVEDASFEEVCQIEMGGEYFGFLGMSVLDREHFSILAEGNDGHDVIFRVNVGKGQLERKCDVISIGAQVWGGVVKGRAYLREDLRSVRLIQGRHGYDLELWRRGNSLVVE